MSAILFAICATLVVFFALIVVLHPDPVRSLLAVVVAFAALAVIYVQLSAPLLAALQIIVYTGAILVLFLFVIMLLNAGPMKSETAHGRGRMIVSLLATGGFAGYIAAKLMIFAIPGPDGPATPQMLAEQGSVKVVARALFERHLFTFEAVSVLLLAALVGALALTKREPTA